MLFFLTAMFLLACAPSRPPLPPGVIPKQGEVPASEEQYGHEVLNQLVSRYPLDRDDSRINRARDIVDRLTERTGNAHNIWHTHVLVGDDVPNAAATRGNHIFVWTGMLKAVKNDDELATILAHEIAHVLAGHTQPTATEEVGKILSDVAGVAAKEVVLRTGGAYGALAGIAGLLVKETLKAVMVNPGSQDNELEADMIGLYIMADAGYDPNNAVAFWERHKDDPSFSGAPVNFLSSHPNSEERLAALKSHLPDAFERYKRSSQDSFAAAEDFSSPNSSTDSQSESGSDAHQATYDAYGNEVWVVEEAFAPIYLQQDEESTLLVELPRKSEVSVSSIEGRWLVIVTPVRGYARSFLFAPRP